MTNNVLRDSGGSPVACFPVEVADQAAAAPVVVKVDFGTDGGGPERTPPAAGAAVGVIPVSLPPVGPFGAAGRMAA